MDSIEIADVVAGATGAWQRLFGVYAPVVDRIARTSHSMGSFARSDDARRDVMARVFERMRRDEFRALRLYLRWEARNPAKSFDDWLVIVTTNVIRDYVSERLGAPSADGTSLKALLEAASELSPDSPELLVFPHITTRETAREIVAFARSHLPEDQARVLAAWLEGSDFAEIAASAEVQDARAAERLLRAGLARLRRHVAR